MPSDRYWQMLDQDHPEYVSEVVALANWSHNCDYPTPMSTYLDLIGWSEAELGENLCKDTPNRLGYLELSYLADALQEYTKRPTDVYEWVTELMKEEME